MPIQNSGPIGDICDVTSRKLVPKYEIYVHTHIGREWVSELTYMRVWRTLAKVVFPSDYIYIVSNIYDLNQIPNSKEFQLRYVLPTSYPKPPSPPHPSPLLCPCPPENTSLAAVPRLAGYIYIISKSIAVTNTLKPTSFGNNNVQHNDVSSVPTLQGQRAGDRGAS